MPVTASSSQTITARDFADLFHEGWRSPAGAQGILDFFGPYLDPAVHMTGPLSPDCHGFEQVEEHFRLLFDVIPDLHGRVVDSRLESDEVVYLTVELEGTIGTRVVKLHLRDKPTVRDGRLVERIAKGRPLSVTRAMMLSASTWPARSACSCACAGGLRQSAQARAPRQRRR